MKSNAEARRNCYMALPKILTTTIARLTHRMFRCSNINMRS